MLISAIERSASWGAIQVPLSTGSKPLRRLFCGKKGPDPIIRKKKGWDPRKDLTLKRALAADLVLSLHFFFATFAGLGGFLVIREPGTGRAPLQTTVS
jgi:hypothetical protein